jgi:hypothetical protein
MTTLKIVTHELSTASESLLKEVTNFIKSAKVDAAVSDQLPRTPGLHQGKVWRSYRIVSYPIGDQSTPAENFGNILAVLAVFRPK